MRSMSRYWLVAFFWGCSLLRLEAQCPKRPDPGSVVQDPLTLDSVGGTLNAELTMRHSVDAAGYNHYCMNYATGQGEVEAPTLRLKQGDHLVLDVKDRIVSEDNSTGMDSMDVLDQNLSILRDFQPLGEKQLAELREHGRRFSDGRYELFKSTLKYDGDLGREQHNYPTSAELPA